MSGSKATKVVVNFLDKPSYDVRIGAGLLSDVGQRARLYNKGTAAILITDSNVGPLYAGEVQASLAQAGYQVTLITVPAGENSKCLDCAAELYRAAAAAHLSRDGLVVALGGGVVGDLAGFFAATYMRGISYLQVPTTLLAMVDSSVGGKTAVNLEEGKNLVGCFKQPIHVCASQETLATLPAREWECGCGEIAKSAVICSDDFFFWLLDNAQALANRDEAVTKDAIVRCVVFKADVVARDETESNGVRECLNYGHTLAHAIEQLAGYGTYSHGAAVAQGMRFAARLGQRLVSTPKELVSTQDELLDALNLPALDWSAPAADIIDCMRGDKKVRGGHLRFVLPKDVGDWVVKQVEAQEVEECLKEMFN